MIEIMCRDGSTSSEMLELVADYVRNIVEDEVEVLYPDEHRAMVFWGTSDMMEAAKQFGSAFIDAKDPALCGDLLADIEPEIHRAMLEVGRDVINEYLLSLDEEIASTELKEDTEDSEEANDK